MSRSELLAAALALEPEERIALSVELLESLRAVEDDVEGAWATEIDRRVDELERGTAETVAAEEGFARYGRAF
ncbi:MAG: addiction module protein [Myxococcales bacterium]|nr:addiction module protein [Myxococcales bacterium]